MLEEELVRMSWTLRAMMVCKLHAFFRTGYFFLGYSLQYPYYHAFCKQKSAKSLLTSLYKREE
jgi:hypothetical protein